MMLIYVMLRKRKLNTSWFTLEPLNQQSPEISCLSYLPTADVFQEKSYYLAVVIFESVIKPKKKKKNQADSDHFYSNIIESCQFLDYLP
jgi:hypothetical protein